MKDTKSLGLFRKRRCIEILAHYAVQIGTQTVENRQMVTYFFVYSHEKSWQSTKQAGIATSSK